MKVKYKVGICFLGIFLFTLFLFGNTRISAHNVIQRSFFRESGLLTFQKNDELEAILDVPIGNGRELIKAYPSPEKENRYYFFLPAGAFVEKIEVVNGTDCKVAKSAESFSLTETYLQKHVELLLEVIDVEAERTEQIELCFIQAEQIPTLFVSADEETDYLKEGRGNKSDANITLYDAQAEIQGAYAVEIKGHGNSSWSEKEKKSWRLEFENETSLLGLAKGKEFVAISNTADKSHMRNKFVFDMAREMGFFYAPQGEYVNVYINNEFQGLYLLSEKIEVSSERVAINECKSPDKDSVTAYETETEKGYEFQGQENAELACGYLFREDEELYDEMDAGFLTEAGNEYEILYPKRPSGKQVSQLRQYVQDFHNAIQDEEGYSRKPYLDYMDLDSFVKKYLIEQITKNRDGNRRSSYYYMDSYDEDARIFAGPVWDYDIAFGNNTSPMWQLPEGIVGLNPGLDEREEFMAVAIQYYRERFRPYLLKKADIKLDEYRAHIESSAYMDEIRWNSEKEAETSLNAEVESLRKYISERTAFLDAVWLNGKTYYRVNYVDGDRVIHAAYLEEGSAIDEYVPESEDKTFVGWYDEELSEPIDLEKPLTDDMALWAKWE